MRFASYCIFIRFEFSIKSARNSFRKMCILLWPFPKMSPPLKRVGAEFMESHETNGPVLLQNVAWTASGTEASGWIIGDTQATDTRALDGPFLILKSRLRLLNRVGAGFIGVTRKERLCSAESGLDRLGHTSLRTDGLLGADETKKLFVAFPYRV